MIDAQVYLESLREFDARLKQQKELELISIKKKKYTAHLKPHIIIRSKIDNSVMVFDFTGRCLYDSDKEIFKRNTFRSF